MTVDYEMGRDAVAYARMDDGKANVLNDESCAGLRNAIARASDDRAGALVIAGRPGMFSGGIDLEIIRSSDPTQRRAALEGIAHTLLAVWTAPLPTVAAITGHTIAGGAILAMACDLRIAIDGAAKIGANETSLGMTLPTWALVIVDAAIAWRARNEVILAGRLFDPTAASEVGIVTRTAAADELDGVVHAAAAELAELPTHAYAGNKRMLRGAEARRAAALVSAEMGPDFARAGVTP